MKPYRVKRGGKLIGSFLVVHNGQRVNLETKDATEARRRAAMVERGEWPPREGDVAAAVKSALEGAGVNSEPAVASPVEPPAVAAPPVAAPPSPAPSVTAAPAAGAAPVPSQEPAPVSPAAAVNATMAEQADAIEGEAKAALASVGVDLGEIGPKLPGYVGKGVTVATGLLAKVPVRFIAGKWVPRPKLPEEVAVIEPVMGKCTLMVAARYGLDLEKLGPGAWLLILMLASTVLQVGVALASLEGEAATSEGKPDLKPVP